MVRLVRRLERSDRVNLSWIANRKGKRSDCGEGKQWIGNLLVLTCGCGVPFDDPKRRAMSLNDSLSFHDAAAAPRRRGTLTKHRHRRSRNTFTVAFRDSFSWDPRGILVGSSWLRRIESCRARTDPSFDRESQIAAGTAWWDCSSWRTKSLTRLKLKVKLCLVARRTIFRLQILDDAVSFIQGVPTIVPTMYLAQHFCDLG